MLLENILCLVFIELYFWTTSYFSLIYHTGSVVTCACAAVFSTGSFLKQIGQFYAYYVDHVELLDTWLKYEMPFFCSNSIAYIFNSLVDFPFCSYLKQELDLRCAIPLGFYRSALNLGISAGVVFPWGSGFSSMPSPLPERFFLGGNLSPVCTLGGPTSLWGFRTRGLGPTEPRRQFRSNPANENTDSGRDHLGGDLALAVFADFSFDFPSKWLSAKGIHGHFFASAGNVEKLTENAYRNFSLRKFTESFRSSVGVGVVIPTNLFRMEVSNLFLPPIM